MRMLPGAVTVAHEHPRLEEFLILEGELIDEMTTEGRRETTVLRAGDFITYTPGTYHFSRTETGPAALHSNRIASLVHVSCRARFADVPQYLPRRVSQATLSMRAACVPHADLQGAC